MIRPHFVDIESYIVPLLVAHCPAWEQTQDQDAVQAHRPLAATWQVSYSTLHYPCCKDRQFISLWGTYEISTRLPALTLKVCISFTPNLLSFLCQAVKMNNFLQRHSNSSKHSRKIRNTLSITVRKQVYIMNYNVFHQLYQLFMVFNLNYLIFASFYVLVMLLRDYAWS